MFVTTTMGGPGASSTTSPNGERIAIAFGNAHCSFWRNCKHVLLQPWSDNSLEKSALVIRVFDQHDRSACLLSS